MLEENSTNCWITKSNLRVSGTMKILTKSNLRVSGTMKILELPKSEDYDHLTKAGIFHIGQAIKIYKSWYSQNLLHVTCCPM